ncbi:MAG TPA: DUF2243 domain-containing protein [Mesorhizobium sp.]|jgi:uncharacterized membrane protein|nr:DUF2243 domain-containing protein [Mesorhizobium sp.]
MSISAGNDRARASRLGWAAFLLGFSIGGFFDGILLHQILQWHHLLSGLDAPAFADLRVQILADGLFHALMYAIGAAGLVLLWRARRGLAEPAAGRRMLALGLIGFGTWHVADAVLSHWITGIHRIRMDSDAPLAWDLGWLAAFGIAPLLLGWIVRKGGGGSGHAFRADRVAMLLAAATLLGGPVSALPPPDSDGALVLFRPGTEPAAMMAAVHAAGGRMVWTDRSGELWAIALDDPRRARSLYAHGALVVSSSWSALGCLAWSKFA